MPSAIPPAKLAQRLIRPIAKELETLTADLVRVNTVAVPPAGNETPGQRVLQRFFRKHGIKSELYPMAFAAESDSPWRKPERNFEGRRNLFAQRKGTGGGRSLLLSGHMDTVPTQPDAWTDSPWQPTVRKGRMYGLGTFDMKGGVAAQALVLAALAASNTQLKGDLHFESVCDEEWGGGNGTLAGRLRGPLADACIISEGTQLEIYRATRGGFVVDLVCRAGDPSAYFSAGPVVSPAIATGRLLQWVDTWVKRRSTKAKRGAYANVEDPTPVQVLAIESNTLATDIPLSVPLTATVRVYFQFLPHEDVDKLIAAIKSSLESFQQKDKFFSQHPIEWKMLYNAPLLGHEIDARHAFTQSLAQAASAVLGKPATVTVAPYPCDAFILHRLYNIPTLLFGPIGAGAHNADEYVDLRSLRLSAEAMLATAIDWCGLAQ